MSHSNAFVNVLLIAMDDMELRKALGNDVVAALKKWEIGEDLTTDEIGDLKRIFEEPLVVGQEAGPQTPPACPYRGYS